MSAVLELRSIWKGRGAGTRATEVLRDASLSVAPGEVVLLVGPSGSGKTTLLAVAAGLLVPSRGEVLLGARPLEAANRTASAQRRRREVGFVFQRPSLLPALTLEENVRLAGALAGCAPGETGEEQRAAVARALVHRPVLVLADEPTGNLDRTSGLAVAERLAWLAGSRRVGVLVATHDDRLAPFATRRLRLVDGHVEPCAGG